MYALVAAAATLACLGPLATLPVTLETLDVLLDQKPSVFLPTPAPEGEEQYNILRTIVFPPTFSLLPLREHHCDL